MKRCDLVDCETGIGCWTEIGEVNNGQYVRYEDADAKIMRMRDALELIRDNGGKRGEVDCTGSWCAEQARRTLEQTALTGKDGGK